MSYLTEIENVVYVSDSERSKVTTASTVQLRKALTGIHKNSWQAKMINDELAKRQKVHSFKYGGR